MTSTRLLSTMLYAVVLARLVFHVLYVPVFEGPDEPFHLARAAAFADTSFERALQGVEVGGDIVAAIRDHPCGPDLSRAFGCLPFASNAAFNILSLRQPEKPAAPTQNYEAHQPPLYYLAAGGLLRAGELLPKSLGLSQPVGRLLLLRLFSVALVAIALLVVLRKMEGARSGFLLGLLAVLLSPGAAESLARCANDAAVFLWAAVILWAIERRTPVWTLMVLFACGPLIKLTVVPVVVFGVAWVWTQRGRILALVCGASSLLFVPLQWLRGWAWGGTVELNAARGGIDEPLLTSVVGLGRTVYTFVKTTFWLGEWSFFRPPFWLVVSACGLLVALALSVRLRSERVRVRAHGFALAATVAGFLLFALQHRAYFDTWGGVGGWYAWGWLPWLALAASDLLEFRPRLRRPFIVAAVALLVTANIAWFVAASRVYGM